MGEAELSHDDLLTRGREALGRGAWSDARDSFERAVALSETPDALEGLGAAAWWQNDAPAVFEAREHAYRLYRRREDRTGAGRMASALALDNVVFRGEEPVASGWLQRAHRLLDGLGPTPERAFLALTEGALSVVLRSDTEAARRLASEALEMGRGLGITDVEMLALALGGLVLVSGGPSRRACAGSTRRPPQPSAGRWRTRWPSGSPAAT